MKTTEFGVSISKKVDVGFAPYMAYLASLNGRGPAFGTRENSTVELTLWAKAQLGEEEDLGAEVDSLARTLEAMIDRQLQGMGVQPSGPEDVFIEKKVAVAEGEW